MEQTSRVRARAQEPVGEGCIPQTDQKEGMDMQGGGLKETVIIRWIMGHKDVQVDMMRMWNG